MPLLTIAPTKPTNHSTVTVLKVNCGCGAHFDSLREAEEHSQETSHILHISGEIRPTRRF